jgi:hypothetical protein
MGSVLGFVNRLVSSLAVVSLGVSLASLTGTAGASVMFGVPAS